MPRDDQTIGEQLVDWGKVALLETVGRTSAKPVTTAVGFIDDDDDGSLLVAAGSETSDWALNLRANPACRAKVGERVLTYLASEVVDDAERARPLAELVLKYGTPAERLGHGPVFRLVPTASDRGG